MNINEIVSLVEELVVRVKTLEIKLAKISFADNGDDNA